MSNQISLHHLILLAGLFAACEQMNDGVMEPLAERQGRVAGAAGEYSSWSPAASIESAPPGADPDFNTPSFVEGCPFISRDGKSFYIASNRPGGGGGLDIWVSTRAGADDPWGEPVNVGEPVNSSADDFCPTIARDGHTFYFVSKRQLGVEGVDWCGGGDIYATRLQNGGFGEPENLGCTVNSASDEFSPFPLPESDAGPVLYFSSTRPGLGTGGDLYMTESHGGAFGPAQLVPDVNSSFDDGQPNVRRDGLELFFYSNREAAGGNDIYVASRPSTSAPWTTPANLGPDVNSAASETRPSLSWDGTTLYFGTTREGSSDVYVTTRENLTGAGD